MLGTIWLDGYDINASMVDSGYAWVYRFEDNAIVPAISNMNPQHKRRQKGYGQTPTLSHHGSGDRQTKSPERKRRNNHDERASSVTQLVLNDSGRLTMPVYYRDQQYCPTCLTKVLKSEDGSLAHLGEINQNTCRPSISVVVTKAIIEMLCDGEKIYVNPIRHRGRVLAPSVIFSRHSHFQTVYKYRLSACGSKLEK
jgi:hypothetical protein